MERDTFIKINNQKGTKFFGISCLLYFLYLGHNHFLFFLQFDKETDTQKQLKEGRHRYRNPNDEQVRARQTAEEVRKGNTYQEYGQNPLKQNEFCSASAVEIPQHTEVDGCQQIFKGTAFQI